MALGTMLTSFGARTMTLRGSPDRKPWTFSEASARAFRSASEMSGETSSRSRTFPATCTTQVTASSTSRAGSATGQPAVATEAERPRRSQPSSAVYGATSDSMTARVSAASRTAGSAAPGPESMALRAALVSSIMRATATLNRWPSTSLVTSSTVLWTVLRRLRSPAAKSAPGAEAAPASTMTRKARARNFCEAAGETSAQSMSSSGGPAKIMVSRTASTPKASICWPRSTPLPRDLDIALPWLMTWPWFSSRAKGSVKSTMPMSCRTLVKNREYSRCRMACSTPPTYWSIGPHWRTFSTSNGPSS
nr:hypothetical protein GCM10020093_045450 [Planobispora longispora]